MMDEFHETYPQYGLCHNRGYATPDHFHGAARTWADSAAQTFICAGEKFGDVGGGCFASAAAVVAD